MSASTPNRRRMWGMYVRVSLTRDPNEGMEGAPRDGVFACRVARSVATTERIAVISSVHHGTSFVCDILFFYQTCFIV
jgi:hypothetical protein